jgi:glycosyltransferase involved in cell wall biosynthesis
VGFSYFDILSGLLRAVVSRNGRIRFTGAEGAAELCVTGLSVSFWHEAPPPEMPSYVRNDYDAIAQFAKVRWYPATAGWRRGFGPTGWLPTRTTLQALRESDIVVQWFANVSGPIVGARLLRRPSVIITGGYDVAAVAEIEYGRMLLRRTRWMGRLALSTASLVLSISRANQSEVAHWAPRARTRLLYLGFDPESFSDAGEKRGQVLTIGSVSREYLERKGLDTFARTSRLLSEIDFIVAGRIVDQDVARYLREQGSRRLKLLDYVPQEEMIRLLQESAVYAQFSVHEGFGCSVAEGMLSGCTPVVSNRGALPEVVGDCGYYVPPKEPEAAARAVLQALTRPTGRAARERILREFSLPERSRRLRRYLLGLRPTSSHAFGRRSGTL